MKNDQLSSEQKSGVSREMLAAMVSELVAECIRLGITFTYSGDRYGDSILYGEGAGLSSRCIRLSSEQAPEVIDRLIKLFNVSKSGADALRNAPETLRGLV